MSHFYGVLQGNRGQATRCGTKKSELRVTAASWQGAVEIRLWHDPETDKNMVSVYKRSWHGAGIWKILYKGPVGEEKTYLLETEELL